MSFSPVAGVSRCVRLRLVGDLNASTQTTLRQAYDVLVRAGYQHFLLDLAHVPAVNSTGAGALISIADEAGLHGRSIMLVSPTPAVGQVLSLLGLNVLLPVVADEEAAIRRLTCTGCRSE